MENRNCCYRCLCCACCLPKWATIIVWFIIISILIVIIVIGGIMSKFVLPTVEVLGVSNSTGNDTSPSPLSFVGDTLRINFGLVVKAVNPNLLPIYISDMNATAYYSDVEGSPYVGGGFLGKQDLPQYSNFTFIFPFSIIYDPVTDPTQVVLTDLATRCGLMGDEPQPLTISYTIRVAARVLFVTVHPTISSQSTFPCPIQNQTLSI
ncbi:hypothetical protein BJ944DRAFT_195794 [Cunninghamella echinulata]|nr:hypothetical protein BJ944DRAFT_195794 [Cunninghamella echinulata]